MANCYLYYNGRHHLMGVYKSTKRGVNLLYKDMMTDEKNNIIGITDKEEFKRRILHGWTVSVNSLLVDASVEIWGLRE